MLVPGRAGASCGVAPRYVKAIEQAPAVFVGEVVELTNDRRWATVDVTDPWTGELLPRERVEVRAGPRDPGGRLSAMTTVDRYYKLGRTYLFVPYKQTRDLVFRDNACTRTSLYRPELERFRPAGSVVASPTPSETEESHPLHDVADRGISGFQWFITGSFAVVILGLVVYSFVRRPAQPGEGRQ